MKPHRTTILPGAILGFALLATAMPLATAQSGAKDTFSIEQDTPMPIVAFAAPKSGQPAFDTPQPMTGFAFPGMDAFAAPKSGRSAFDPFEERLFQVDGPTDGMDHPPLPVTHVIEPPDSLDGSTAKVDVRATVDRAAGFRFDKMSILYLDGATDPDATPGAAPAAFGGKPASAVSVLGRPWDDLSQPHQVFAKLDPMLMTRLLFEAGGCDVRYSEHGDVFDVFFTNRTNKPAEIAFTLWNASEYRYVPPASANPGPFASMPETRGNVGFGMGGYSPDRQKPREYPAGTVSVEGIFGGRGRFVFEGDTIVYRHEDRWNPTNVRINGKNWDDLEKPFKLEFTPDHEHAAILQQQGRSHVRLTLKPDTFELLIDDAPGSSSIYYVRVGTKTDSKPKKAAPAPQKPSEPVFGPGRKVVLKGTLDRDAGFRVDGNTLSYLNYHAEGRILPTSTGGRASINGRQVRDPGPLKIPLYVGEFASGVSVNGKPWDNLTHPFELNVSQSKSVAKTVDVKADHCEVRYQHYGDLFEIAISNKSAEPVPFELTIWLSDPPESK